VSNKVGKPQQQVPYESDTMSNGSDAVRSSKVAVGQAANKRRQSLIAETHVENKSAAAKQTHQQDRHFEDANKYEKARVKSTDAGRPAASSGHRSAQYRNHSDSKHVGSDDDDDMDNVEHTSFQQNMAAGYAPPDDEDEEEEEMNQNYRKSDGHQASHFDDDDEEGDYGEGSGLDGTAELIQKTVGLLSAHKLSIAEMVEVRFYASDLVFVQLCWCTGDEGGDGAGARDGKCGRPRLGAVH
jgi:hypothetical protein